MILKMDLFANLKPLNFGNQYINLKTIIKSNLNLQILFLFVKKSKKKPLL